MLNLIIRTKFCNRRKRQRKNVVLFLNVSTSAYKPLFLLPHILSLTVQEIIHYRIFCGALSAFALVEHQTIKTQINFMCCAHKDHSFVHK